MEESKVVTLYNWIDSTTIKIEELTDEPYLDSLILTLEAMFYGDIHDEQYEAVNNQIRALIPLNQLDDYTTEQVRKAIQLTVLKGMKENTQQQHIMTPETIALFIGYLASKLTNQLEEIRIFDPVSGIGNLLLTVMNYIEKPMKVYASEVDPTLLKIALLNANLQKKRVEYFHQDSLRPLLLDPVDLVVADLPVGYYPDDVQASEYELQASEGHSYSHHLFIEQSLEYTKSGRFLIFIIPEFLFESDQADQLYAFIQKNAHIIGLIQLPETAFASKQHKKSIFILQKKGLNTVSIQEPLLAKLPSFKNTAGMEDMLDQINHWFSKTEIHL